MGGEEAGEWGPEWEGLSSWVHPGSLPGISGIYGSINTLSSSGGNERGYPRYKEPQRSSPKKESVWATGCGRAEGEEKEAGRGEAGVGCPGRMFPAGILL